MKVAKSMFVGALVLGGLVAVAAPASADFRRADIRQDQREVGHDYAELNRDRREYFHDLHNGASRAELTHDRREIWQVGGKFAAIKEICTTTVGIIVVGGTGSKKIRESCKLTDQCGV